MADVFRFGDKVRKTVEKAGLKIPASGRDNAKVVWRPLLQSEWSKLATDKCHNSHIYPQSNTWFDYGKQYFNESDFITGIKLKTDKYPTRATLARSSPGYDATCRHCHTGPETIGHIS
ncbi:hypothetical protein DPMN_114504 [Dreissena polymorpha]|uniref:Uncharacterized protein n=1 Tax=Dreissena polymorpha TaxID=45954 RepID=A0A9D4KK53_DREPO|nr:hypothetical protein DPMN_114504 [Dreissena polymorpha]